MKTWLAMSAALFADCAGVATTGESIDEALRWGTYHSGLYFGVRSRTFPFHVSAGLLWSSTGSQLRHECLESDGLEQYGWQKHDGRHFGSQAIHDQHNNLLLETTFLKPLTSPTTFESRAWATRIAASTLRTTEGLPKTSSLFFYVDLGCEDDALENSCRANVLQGSQWTVNPPRSCRQPVDKKSCLEMELVSEHEEQTLAFHSRIQVHFRGDASLLNVRYFGDSSWNIINVKDKLAALASNPEVHRDAILDNSFDKSASFGIIQVRYDPSAVYDVTVRVLYEEQVEKDSTPVVVFDDLLPSLHERFDTQFSAAFPIHNPALVKLGQAALSNLVGGIGYFYGSTILESADKSIDRTPSLALFTAVPSRPFFPRGFLWDEGFHQLGIVAFDKDLTVQIMDHWLNLMDNDGYISREQIRGALAERRIPKEFVTQHTTHANPPTLLLALEKLVPVVDVEILKRWWPKIKLWFSWFQRTQAGSEPNTFRWRGRDPDDGKLMPNTLSSGLDDYPRASHPSYDERHVDLAAWMIKGSLILAEVADAIGDAAAAKGYRVFSSSYLEAMEALHWDSEDHLYYDYGLHSADGIFEDHVVIACQSSRGNSIQTTANIAILRSSGGDAGCPESHPRFLYPLGDGSGGLLTKQVFVPKTESLQFVKRVGYVNFFPLFLQTLPGDSPKLGPLAENLARHLLSPHGLLSLSPGDVYFERPNAPGDAPYWRGPIWFNINYLALTSFHYYAKHASDATIRQTYSRLYQYLRDSLIETVGQEFEATGYLYEQYNQRTGRGQRSHPFTGWTALIVNVLAEVY
ncbi:hypothetical protein Ae201684P_004692 [Aphanomyces euteiches]|nr:hypothetical protein Ae201684P_004692 [Aphanomyces euteiches]